MPRVHVFHKTSPTPRFQTLPGQSFESSRNDLNPCPPMISAAHFGFYNVIKGGETLANSRNGRAICLPILATPSAAGTRPAAPKSHTSHLRIHPPCASRAVPGDEERSARRTCEPQRHYARILPTAPLSRHPSMFASLPPAIGARAPSACRSPTTLCPVPL